MMYRTKIDSSSIYEQSSNLNILMYNFQCLNTLILLMFYFKANIFNELVIEPLLNIFHVSDLIIYFISS